MDFKQKKDIAAILCTIAVSAVLMLWLAVNAPGDALSLVRDYAETKGISVEEYPQSLISLLERNPETEEFVLNYPFRQELETDLSGYDLTEGVPLLIQWDPRWGYMEYGSDLVAVSGGGPLCLAMAGYYLTGDERFYPDKMVEFALANDYDSKGSGSKWTLIGQGARELGLSVKELPAEEQKIAAYLNSGAVIIAAVGPGDFSSTGNFIVITGYRDGKFTVNDPGSYVNSEKLWEFEEIKYQFRSLWAIRRETESEIVS